MTGSATPLPRTRLATILFLALLIAGAGLRLARLETRPLHGDEAVGASLALDVARTGSFLYESANRHGPFPYFLDGWVMRARGDSTFWIRFPFALAGSLVVLAIWPMRAALGEAGWLLAASTLTFSPFFVYYSRYAIQEILFVLATALMLAFAVAFARTERGAALAAAILSAAWMVTQKESFVIVWGCLAAASLGAGMIGGPRSRAALARVAAAALREWRSGVAGGIAGSLLVAGFYTDFFRDGSGLIHLATNLAGLLRHGAATEAAATLHRHDASFYTTLLARYEWFAVAGCVAGAILALRRRRPLSLFLAAYTLLLLGVHFALAYKTPWLLLTPLLGMSLTAGDAARWAAERFQGAGSKAALGMAALLPVMLLPATLRTSFQHPADPALGLAYHHAGAAQAALADEIRHAIAAAPAEQSPKAIVALPYYWPLAWYLRDETDILFEASAAPEEPQEQLASVPILVTMQSADPRFIKSFAPGGVPDFDLPGHASRTVILIPPDYLIGRVWTLSSPSH